MSSLLTQDRTVCFWLVQTPHRALAGVAGISDCHKASPQAHLDFWGSRQLLVSRIFPERLKSARLYRNSEPGASVIAYQQGQEL